MKLCKDCEYYSEGFCISPENGQDLVTGGVKERDASLWRTDITLGYERCGSEGRFFVPKTSVTKTSVPWWAFWRKWS